jgi:transcription-repair coupling factor (superfamily II helicase)
MSSEAPAGLLALQLLQVWSRSGSAGIAFLAQSELRAERVGSILQELHPHCGVLVLPALDGSPFHDVTPSRDIAGRRANVLRRLADASESPLLVSTADAVLPRVPRPEVFRQASLRLTVGLPLSSDAMQPFLAAAGYELGEPADYPGGVLLHGNAIEIFPAGALRPVRIEHADGLIRAIRLFDPENQVDLGRLDRLVIDPMSESNVVAAAAIALRPDRSGRLGAARGVGPKFVFAARPSDPSGNV